MVSCKHCNRELKTEKQKQLGYCDYLCKALGERRREPK